MRLIFTVPTALAAFVFAPWFTTFFKEPALLPLIRMSGLLIVAVSLNELFDLMTIGISRFRFLFFVRGSMLAAKVSLVIAAVFLGFGVEGVFGGFIAGIFIPCALSAFMLFSLSGAPAPAGDTERIWSRLFRLSVPLAVSGASVAIFTVEDKLMLGYFQSKVDVGFYSVARSFAETALFPTFALIMMLRPGLASAYAAGDRERCAVLTNRSIRGSFVYAALVAVVFVCLARGIVVGLVGEKFEPSARLLMLFIPLIVMRCVGVVVLPGLIAANRAGIYARLTVAGAAVNFILNILLIPKLAATGAIIATLASYIPIEVIGLKTLWSVFPRFWGRADTVVVAKTAPVAALIALAYRFFVDEPANLFMTILHALAITAIFGALALVFKIVTRAELAEIIRPLFGKSR